MKLDFLGATEEVTGSKFMLTTKGGMKILLDCGMYQGNNRSYHKWRAPKKFWDDYVIETIT